MNLTPANIGALALTGGTLTGNLTVASTTPYFILKDTDLESNVTTSGETDYILFRDKNDVNVGQINPWINNGIQYMRYLTQRAVSGSNKYNILSLGLDASGNAIVRIEGTGAAEAWRNAIGTIAADYTDMHGSNLNNQQPGECWWGNNFTNAPASGYHQVFRQGMYQVAFSFATTSTEPMMYLRSYVNSTWQPWARLDNNDIGKYKLQDVTTNVSMPNSQYKTIGKVTLTAGTWIINFHAHFQTSANGYRFICISRSDNNSDGAWNRWSGIQVPAVSGGNTYIGTQLVVRPSSTLDYYGIGYQNSGGALNATGLIEAVRIK